MDSFVVKKDDVVEKGQLIGYSGMRQNTDPHLHFEIRQGDTKVDPVLLLSKSVLFFNRKSKE